MIKVHKLELISFHKLVVMETYDNLHHSHQLLFRIRCFMCGTVFFVFRQCALFSHVIVVIVIMIGIVHVQSTLLGIADLTLSIVYISSFLLQSLICLPPLFLTVFHSKSGVKSLSIQV